MEKIKVNNRHCQEQSDLMSLPQELIELILKNFDTPIIMELSILCHFMNDVCQKVKSKIKNIVLRKAAIDIKKLYQICETLLLERCNFEYCTFGFGGASLDMLTSLHVVGITWGASNHSSFTLPVNIKKCILHFSTENTHSSQESKEHIFVYTDSCISLEHFELICDRGYPNKFDIYLPRANPPTLKTFIWNATRDNGYCIAPLSHNWCSNLEIIKIYRRFQYCIQRSGDLLPSHLVPSILPKNPQIEYFYNRVSQ